MTHLEIRRLSEPSWAINHVHLTEGYWVLLVGNEQIGNELARRLVGDQASKGTILLNGKEPYRSPATRATCISVQMNEAPTPAVKVRDVLVRDAFFSDESHDTPSSLKSFGLEHLIDRRHESLSAQERRQVAFVSTLARRDIELAVYCEPRLDLTAAQLAQMQDHMSRLASRACVLCITASLHDASQLGGPHAQLTRNGWSWVTAAADASAATKILIEGTGLRLVAAHLALQNGVTDVRMQLESGRELLLCSATANSRVTCEAIRVARQNHANVTRICMDEALVTQDLAGDASSGPPHRNVDLNVAGATQVCTVVRKIWARQRELLAKALLTPPGLLPVLGAPLVTASYAAGQRPFAAAEALQNTLTFLITYIVPLGSLLGVRALNRDSALGALRQSLARSGVNRRILVSADWVVTGVTCATVAAVSAAVGVLLASGSATADLGTCAWIAALGAVTYAAIFMMMGLFRRGWLQWVYLIINLWLGASVLGIAVLFPHAHLLNLLGSPGMPELAQPVSSVSLGVMTLLAFWLMLMRTET